MRNFLLPLSIALMPFVAVGQGPSSRFVEVIVTDTVRLPFMGMDYEVRMPNPYETVGAQLGEGEQSEKQIANMVEDAEKKATDADQRFVEMMKANGFSYRLRSTEHAEDYYLGTGRKADVNTYSVQLKSAAESEKYFKLTEGSSEYVGTMGEQHFGPASAEAPRIMKKLYEQAVMKATALASVSGGKLGPVISAQETVKSEGSFLEQIFRMEKSGKGDSQDPMMEMLSTHSTTMAFRFELLAK
jgi:hypothetical protein